MTIELYFGDNDNPLQSQGIRCVGEQLFYAELLTLDAEPISTNPILAFSCKRNNFIVEKKYLIGTKSQDNASIPEIVDCLERIFNKLKQKVAEQEPSLTLERIIE